MLTNVFNKNNVKEICSLLFDGEVIAIPTETIYGLATLEKTIDKLYEVKNRSEKKPISYLLHDKKEINNYALVNKRNQFLIDNLLPGPVTIVLKSINDDKTIGFRVSTDSFLTEIVKNCNEPLLLTSANLSNEKDLINFDDVFNVFNGLIKGIVKGDCLGQIASTVIDLSREEVIILRDGAISKQEIMKLVEEFNLNENCNS